MKNKITLISTLLCILFSSCVKEQLETTYNKQEDQIDSYITKNMVKKNESGGTDTLRVVRNNGANRLVLKEGVGDPLAEDGYVSFYYAGYIFTGSPSTMFGTNRKESAEEAGWNVEDGDYELMEMHFKDSELIQGLKNGLAGVKAGEECEILFSAKYGFGNKAFGIVPAKTALLYRIWVIGVTND